MQDAEVRTYLITSGTYFVSCAGDLVESSVRELVAQLNRLVDGGAREIVLELRDVTEVHTPVLRELIAVGRKASCTGAVATVACEDETISWLLEALGPAPSLEVEPTVPDAFAQVARRASHDPVPAASTTELT